jgi:pimeloyl-ACP methyl ester carboxylesterase
MDVRRFEHRNDGIEWYCEQRGDGPPLVLVPSGEGDCASFENVAATLADQFTVLTFDMPGFSRSRVDSEDSISVALLSDQIAALVTSLEIGPAAFYGCSSGGMAVLDLAVRHAAAVQKAIVHEVALAVPEVLNQLLAMDDSAVVETCRFVYANIMNDDPAAWEALGAEFHERLAPNYVTWVRRYVAPGAILRLAPEELAGKPITWTIVGLTPAAGFLDNVVLATKAGIDIGLLDCKHFPQVSAPEMLAERIRAPASVSG